MELKIDMSEEVEKSSRAWVLNFGEGIQAAVGHHEMWQVLISPKFFNLPCTPPYCCEVAVFQNRILPVLDVSHLLEGKKTIPIMTPILGIAVYQNDPTQPLHYGGLHLATMPQSVYVNDEQACDFPAHQPYWEPLAISCFSHDEIAIPIINLASLFTQNVGSLQQNTNANS